MPNIQRGISFVWWSGEQGVSVRYVSESERSRRRGMRTSFEVNASSPGTIRCGRYVLSGPVDMSRSFVAAYAEPAVAQTHTAMTRVTVCVARPLSTGGQAFHPTCTDASLRWTATLRFSDQTLTADDLPVTVARCFRHSRQAYQANPDRACIVCSLAVDLPSFGFPRNLLLLLHH